MKSAALLLFAISTIPPPVGGRMCHYFF